MNGTDQAALRRAAIWVAALSLAYFSLEFGVARRIGSVSLFADSIDFLEDASVNGLILLALGWSPRRRAFVGMLLAFVLLLPAFATAWTAWQKFNSPLPPAPVPLSLTGLGAFTVNLSCALILARVRHAGGSLSRAAFLSIRNDVFSNVAILLVGGITWIWASVWPDLVVGLGIFVLNLDAAREVYEAAQKEREIADTSVPTVEKSAAE